MNNGALRYELFVCECDNVKHQLVFSYFKDEQEDEVCMEVHLIPEYNIWKRIWNAVKYIFGYRSKYGHFDCFIFQKCDAPKLAKILKHLDPDVFKICSQESESDFNP